MSILDEFPEDKKWVDRQKIEYTHDYHSWDYVDWLEEKVEELEKQKEALKKELASARQSLDNIRYKEARRFRDEQDYLPYEERYD